MITEIKVSPELLEEMIVIHKWYKAMPNHITSFDVGERFHENIFDFFSQPVPLVEDPYYLSHFEMNEQNQLCAVFYIEGDEELNQEILVPFIGEQ